MSSPLHEPAASATARALSRPVTEVAPSETAAGPRHVADNEEEGSTGPAALPPLHRRLRDTGEVVAVVERGTVSAVAGGFLTGDGRPIAMGSSASEPTDDSRKAAAAVATNVDKSEGGDMPTTSTTSMLDLNFAMAAADSPWFRAQAQRVEDEVERVALWLDAVLKHLRAYTEETLRNNETSSLLAVRVHGSQTTPLELVDEDLCTTALRTFADAMQCVYPFKAKMIDDLQEYLLTPLIQFSKEDIKEMREARRNYDRMTERYDGTAVQRFFAMSKLKEASALREDAFQLYDLRKAYVHASMDYTARAIRFKLALDRLLLDQFTDAMDSMLEFYQSAADVYRGLKPQIDSLKVALGGRRSAWDQRLATLDAERAQAEQRVIEAARPSTALPIGGSGGAMVAAAMASVGTASTPASTQANITAQVIRVRPAADAKTEREGLLFKKSHQKSPMTVPTWSRKWVFIKEGKFGYVGAARKKGCLSASTPISVLLCEVRVDDRHDRRYCFEVLSSKRSHVLQAETEAEFISWLETFEAAKVQAMRRSREAMALSPVVEHIGEMKYVADEEEWETISQPPIIRRVTRAESDAIAASVAVTGDVATVKIKYPESELERRNEELHALVRAVPAGDFVLDSFPSAIQVDGGVSIQGRVYLTQNRLCFYSNILTSVTRVVIPFGEILSLERRPTAFKDVIVVATKDAQYIFTTYLRNDAKTFGAMSAVHVNTRAESPLSLQDLLDKIHVECRAPRVSEDSEAALARLKLSPKKTAVEDAKATAVSTESFTAQTKDVAALAVGDATHAKDADCWPAEVPVPSADIHCGCSEHLEKIEQDIELELSPKRLFDLLFGDGKFFAAVHERGKDWDIKVADWSPSATAPQQRQRDIRWMLSVNNPMVKVKETECTETQTVIKRDEHLCYVVECCARTPSMPYGDAFQTVARYCIAYRSKKSARLVISIGVRFSKSVMVKSLIKNAALKGLSEYVVNLMQLLSERTAAAVPGGTSVIPSQKSADKDVVDDAKAGSIATATPSHRPPPLHASMLGDFSSIANLVMTALLVLSLLLNVHLYRGSSSVSSLARVRDVITHGSTHGIYLRDLESDVFNSTLVSAQATRDLNRRDSFMLFLRDASAYKWHRSRHSVVARDLDKVIGQVRGLRHNILRTFAFLNDIEVVMLEAEYINWMTDQTAQCWDNESRLKRLVVKTETTSPQVAAELGRVAHACKLLAKDLNDYLTVSYSQ